MKFVERSVPMLLVDPQKDFHPGGSLAIPAAGDDSERISSFIDNNKSKINKIITTLDSHHKLHIAHSGFWKDENGNHPPIFSTISSDDVKSGKWKPRKDLVIGEEDTGTGFAVNPEIFPQAKDFFDGKGGFDIQKYCELYTETLEKKGKFQLTIWPEHCLMGSPGHNVVDNINKAINDWVGQSGVSIEWVHKGQNLLTEMYSAFQAEVPVSKKTVFNDALLESLKKSDKVFIGGQALSHCVNYTVRDLVQKWPENERDKIHILTDCASNVPGFEDAGSCFLDEMKSLGVTICTSSEASLILQLGITADGSIA